MNILLETHLNIEGSRVMRRSNFKVNSKDFKNDPDFTSAVIAYEWIQEQKKETGFQDTIIEKVIYDNEYDITELVKKIRPVIYDDLPF